ncbi:hypothetical protein AMJ44_12775 [candidate division WOR-1 bacterium DG_54_3]|uniref:Uncharacterized protein n=1 Tax=candidate division WOR-1 bacterium DG_54_3 TaxID=1703775 RepID=A0A0S7XPN2_UNCSA|nr:MAG: hypothetical protein AMJ44_12775 [candidate division WOR-1 bacterium DG_54_3]
MVFFILSLVCFTLILGLYLIQTKKWTNLIYLVFFILILTAILIYSQHNRLYTIRGTKKTYEEILVFLSMCIGMISNRIVDGIKGKRFRIKLPEIIKPLFVSPIVFLFLWGVIQRMEEFSFITYCFAFQNGFFWQAVLERIGKNISKN